MADLDNAIARARDGDDDAFAQVYRAHQPLLLRYLRGVAPSVSDDLASEVWLDVIRGLGSFSGDEAGFRGWLFTIARRRVIDMRRTRSRRPEVLFAETPDSATTPDSAAAVERSIGTDWAISLISQLPAQQAEVVLLRVVAGLDVPAVAEIVGRRPATVRVQSHRGLKRLAEILADGDDAVTHPLPPAM